MFTLMIDNNYVSENEPYYATIDIVPQKDSITVFDNQAYSQIGVTTVHNEAYAALDSKRTEHSEYTEIPDVAAQVFEKGSTLQETSCEVET